MFKFIPFSIVCVLLQMSLTSASPQGYLSKAGDFWTTLGVVPVLIDAAPPETLIVEYEGGLTVNGGNQLTPTQVQNKPVKIQWTFQDGDLFTLCLIDPDAPSRDLPLLREFQHWIVVNVPGNDFMKGEALAVYLGSQPPPLTGFHRYTFLVYKQPNYLTCDENRLLEQNIKGRGKFSIRKFAAKYNLGQPVAGNVFLSKA
ncbi:protein D3-like [Daphnia pulex]|uniref:protein D3-like n=1 Tax=Daphnia pulex TaxID=6669 RepID=UPI001EE08FA8|nr:protein D3-like [Daphnia pulex]